MLGHPELGAGLAAAEAACAAAGVHGVAFGLSGPPHGAEQALHLFLAHMALIAYIIVHI